MALNSAEHDGVYGVDANQIRDSIHQDKTLAFPISFRPPQPLSGICTHLPSWRSGGYHSYRDIRNDTSPHLASDFPVNTALRVNLRIVVLTDHNCGWFPSQTHWLLGKV